MEPSKNISNSEKIVEINTSKRKTWKKEQFELSNSPGWTLEDLTFVRHHTNFIYDKRWVKEKLKELYPGKPDLEFLKIVKIHCQDRKKNDGIIKSMFKGKIKKYLTYIEPFFCQELLKKQLIHGNIGCGNKKILGAILRTTKDEKIRSLSLMIDWINHKD